MVDGHFGTAAGKLTTLYIVVVFNTFMLLYLRLRVAHDILYTRKTAKLAAQNLHRHR